MIDYQILIDGVDYTSSCSLPFKEQYVLDSALDNAVLTLSMIQKNTIFKPFSKVTITKGNDEPYNMYVASDKMTEIVGTGLYTHELVLIEETKLLEKYVVDTNTTTQPLLHDFNIDTTSVIVDGAVGEVGESPTHYLNYSSSLVKPIYSSPSDVILPSLKDWKNNSETFSTYLKWFALGFNRYYSGYIEIYNINNLNTSIYSYPVNNEGSESSSWDTIPNPTLSSGNSYYVKYYLTGSDKDSLVTDSQKYYILDTFYFSIYTPEEKRTKKSITYVVNRLLAITETLRDNESPKFVFNQEQADFYGQTDSETGEPIYPAPEFSMTKSTLRECLDQVGGYIHSIVRLKDNTIYFDKLGGTTETTLDEDYIGNYETLDCEQYASQLDSIVSNITNIDDEETGTIIEPFRGGYKTVRAESGTLRIGDGQNDTTAIITTDYPIEKIAKLECGFITVNGTNYNVGDITPYVYEKSEYDLLSSYSGTFPSSKGYAITYTQGQNNITGLTFKLSNPVSPIFSNQAILNIISQKIGQSVQTPLGNPQDISELQFRLVYYPSTTARIKQSRTDINNYSMDLASIYNQSANKVDSRAYGENLKGTIARLGNIDKFITFISKIPENVPEVGNYVVLDDGDYYIATLSIENQVDHIKYTIGLSKDFNALSKYIGIKNNIRMYEVSEKQSVERYIIREDYCVIGNAIESDGKDILTHNAKGGLFKEFDTNFTEYNADYVTVARVKGEDIEENPLTEVDLSVISLALGNSIWLGFKYLDNYSAGKQSVNRDGSTSASDQYYRLNQDVRYTDYFGEIEKLSLQMYSFLRDINSKSTAIEVGNALPVSTLLPSKDTYIMLDTKLNDIVIKKDNREQINFAYQLHFVTNDNIIIGSQLAHNYSLVGVSSTIGAKLYILPERINKFAKKIEISNNNTPVFNYLNSGDEYTYSEIYNRITFSSKTATKNGKSWVVVDSDNNLLFGKNIDIKNGDIIQMPAMTFTHKFN